MNLYYRCKKSIVLFVITSMYLVTSKSFAGKGPSKKEKEGISLMPVIAGNSTYGVMLGGAVINYTMAELYHKSFFLTVFTTSKNYHSLLTHEAIGSKFDYMITGSISNYFDAYYGENQREVRDEPDKIHVTKTSVKPSIAYKFSKNLSTGLFLHNKTRIEDGIVEIAEDETTVEKIIYPDERTLLLGFFIKYDHSHEHINNFAPVGRRIELSIDGLPSSESTSIDDVSTFLRLMYDHREYIEVTTYLNVAARLYGGYTFGKPTHLYTFNLGGSDQLRGYRNSRFSGKKFWITQFELRYPIWSIVSGNSYVEVGDIGNDKLDSTLFVYGTGFKVALPPDWVEKMRFDVGFSNKEKMNISMYTDHAF